MIWNEDSSGKDRALQSPPDKPGVYDGGVIESAHLGRWFVTPVRTWLYQANSPYQEIAIGEVPYLGTCLFLDGWLQLAAADEYVYHEHLVVPALLAHPHPERVLILGGGDGLAAREVLRDTRVHQVVMVDLDAMVVDACRRYMSHLQEGAFEDPRLHVIIGDARDFLHDDRQRFHVIIVDLVDLMPETRALFEDVYAGIKRVLHEDGIVVSHAPDPGPPLYEGLYMVNFLREQFPYVAWYQAFISSFGETWTFGLASERVNIAALPANVWRERAAALQRLPRSLVPEALPARFLHTKEEEERLARMAEGHPDAAPPLSPWQATVIDGEIMTRIQHLIGFNK